MKIIQIVAVAAILFAATLTYASAGTKMAPKSKMAASISCPVCHMPMTTTKTATNVAALMVHGKKYYCCSMCAAGKAALKYDKAHPGKTFVAEK
jgi:hypothetical protein